MAQADVHCYDHRSGERFVASGDHWHGKFHWMMSRPSNDHYRTRLIYGDQSEKYLNDSLTVNLITVEKIVCKGSIVYGEKLFSLPPQVVSMLLVFDRLAGLQKELPNWRKFKAAYCAEREIAICSMKEVTAILAHPDIARNFRNVMNHLARVSQAILLVEGEESITACADSFDDCLHEFENFANDLCSPYAEEFWEYCKGGSN